MGILIVEDDEGVCEALTNLLAEEGYVVEVARDGREAWERLQKHPEPPSLILLDLMMPNMNGEEFRARQLSEPRLADIPVVILSAMPNGRRRAESLGVTDFIPKPMHFEELLHVVQNRSVTVRKNASDPGQAMTLAEAWRLLKRSGPH
jgi:CheY-like chemotaxis protein